MMFTALPVYSHSPRLVKLTKTRTKTTKTVLLLEINKTVNGENVCIEREI